MAYHLCYNGIWAIPFFSPVLLGAFLYTASQISPPGQGASDIAFLSSRPPGKKSICAWLQSVLFSWRYQGINNINTSPLCRFLQKTKSAKEFLRLEIFSLTSQGQWEVPVNHFITNSEIRARRQRNQTGAEHQLQALSLEETRQVHMAPKGHVLDLLSNANGKETTCTRGNCFYNSDSLFQGGQGLELSQDIAPSPQNLKDRNTRSKHVACPACATNSGASIKTKPYF